MAAMLTRRNLLTAPLIAPLVGAAIPLASAASSKMTLCLHQNSSLGAGFRGSLEGWARAGIKYVELTTALLDGFLKTDSLAAARRVVSDLGLKAVSCGAERGLWEPGPDRAAALDRLKLRCEQFSPFGVDRIVIPSVSTQKWTLDDYKRGVDAMREVGEAAKAYRMIGMIEFIRGSTFIATLPTTLKLTREANHANVRPMIDVYLFWSGMSQFEDLDQIRPQEIAHVHWSDVPAGPRELLDPLTREIPGEGVAPLARILRKLAERGYSGPASVEVFSPKHQQADPYELARRIRQKAEPIMRQAGVL
jgi:2-keto-myo-inositol isomerase